MYRLGAKEETFFVLNAAQPFVWLALSRDAQELTAKKIRRAMVACCCRNPFLRGVYDETKGKHEIKICSPEEFVRLESEDPSKLPVFVDSKFETKDAAWAEYVRQAEGPSWKSSFTWELSVHLFDAKHEPEVSCAIFATFNHGIADGFGAFLGLKEFLIALNKADGAALPDCYCLGQPTPVPCSLLEALPKIVYDEEPDEEGKEKLYAAALTSIAEREGKSHRLLEVRHIGKEATAKLVSLCRAHKVTVTAAFITAFRVAVGADVVNVSLPINAREGDSEELCSRFISSKFTARLSGIGDFWETAKVVLEGLREAASSEERWHDQLYQIVRSYCKPLPTPVDHMCSPDDGKEATICVSSLGVIEKRICDDAMDKWAPVDVIGVVRNRVGDGSIVWPLTLHGRLSFALMSNDAIRTRAALKRCADTIARTIESII